MRLKINELLGEIATVAAGGFAMTILKRLPRRSVATGLPACRRKDGRTRLLRPLRSFAKTTDDDGDCFPAVAG